MEVSPAKSLILSATIHGGSYFFIQPSFSFFPHAEINIIDMATNIIASTFFFIETPPESFIQHFSI